MRSGGWKPFWAALFASLLVLVPLVGGTVLLSRQQLRTQLRQAARSESGVPIQLPKTTDQLTVLLCVSGEQPGFVLAYLNASQNCVHLLSVPAVLTVPFAEEETSLARCYAAAGPARCREALAQVLALPEGTRYLAFSPDVLERIASRYGPVRVGFTGALTEEELARYGRSRAVQGISAGDAHEFLCQLQADEAFSPVRTAAARAAVWDAFLRQDLDLLPATLPDALRASSSALLTDLTALQNSATVKDLAGYLKADPEKIGAFMAAPVALDTQPVYPVKNYGSGVTPFFTNLALWVAGFILMAMVKLRVDPEGLPKFTAVQAYFGRWLFYMVCGLAMGLVCCVGDLALGIQCESPAAFIGAGLLTVFVDVNLMFALAYAFRHIGKAIAVILLIVVSSVATPLVLKVLFTKAPPTPHPSQSEA